MRRSSATARGASGAAGVARVLWIAAALALGTGPPVLAGDSFDASVERVWFRSDSLRVDLDIEGLFSDRIRDGLARGLPMTFNLQIDLWRSRSSWWDALESRTVRRFKIQRNVFDDRYFVHGDDGKRLFLPDLDALERHLSARRAEFVTRVSGLPQDKTYFVVVSPSLRPLTIEDIEQVEAWLNGEIEESKKQNAVSVITSVPRVFFNVFVDLAGLGDKSTLARSGFFRLEAGASGAPPASREPSRPPGSNAIDPSEGDTVAERARRD